MQGKEASEQETLNCTVGIDVSKTWLDAHALPSSASLRVANGAEGIRQLKRWLLRHKPKLVAVEATGKWHRELCRSLQASQIAVAVTDPFSIGAGWCQALSDCSVDSALMSLAGSSLLFGIGTAAFP